MNSGSLRRAAFCAAALLSAMSAKAALLIDSEDLGRAALHGDPPELVDPAQRAEGPSADILSTDWTALLSDHSSTSWSLSRSGLSGGAIRDLGNFWSLDVSATGRGLVLPSTLVVPVPLPDPFWLLASGGAGLSALRCLGSRTRRHRTHG